MTAVFKKTHLVFAGLIALVLGLVLAAPAFAAEVTAPIKVSDDTTHFSMEKLAKDTHDKVIGAKMAIIEKDTGKVVANWTTGVDRFTLDKVLDVNKMYILRELEAPAGFDIAPDVEFYVNASEAEGITLVTPGNAELIDAITVALYDNRLPVEDEKVLTQRREITTSRETAPKTGDETPLELVLALAAVGIVAAAVLQLLKPRKN